MVMKGRRRIYYQVCKKMKTKTMRRRCTLYPSLVLLPLLLLLLVDLQVVEVMMIPPQCQNWRIYTQWIKGRVVVMGGALLLLRLLLPPPPTLWFLLPPLQLPLLLRMSPPPPTTTTTTTPILNYHHQQQQQQHVDPEERLHFVVWNASLLPLPPGGWAVTTLVVTTVMIPNNLPLPPNHPKKKQKNHPHSSVKLPHAVSVSRYPPKKNYPQLMDVIIPIALPVLRHGQIVRIPVPSARHGLPRLKR
mmetsp:Transcript_14229/g.23214  ORF Transcript_14229/g.23214 Transcript_14229/m.23214 type:complete len:246 (+) Transcript_14229:48-785(+)